MKIGDRVRITTTDSFNGEIGTVESLCGLVVIGGIWVQLDNGIKMPFDPDEFEVIEK